MQYSNIKTKNKYISTLGIFVVGLTFGLLIGQYIAKKDIIQPQVTADNETKTSTSTKSDELSFSYLDLPLDYFSKNDVQWGSATYGNGDKITDYSEAAIKNWAVYQSYPTTSIKIKGYSNEITPLKLLSNSETQTLISKMEMGSYRAEEGFKKFGVLNSHYLPAYYIYAVDKFDVDGDGQDESIVSYTQPDAAGFGAPMTDVIKGNNIIFTLTETGSTVNSILPAEENNGFYAEWGSVGEFNGRCCEEGVNRTRFVFKDNQFVPLYEQEVRYLKIGKEKN